MCNVPLLSAPRRRAGQGGGRRRAAQGVLRVPVAAGAGVHRLLADRRRRRDGGAHRPQRQRQVHRRQPGAALLRPAGRPGARQTPVCALLPAVHAAGGGRARPAGASSSWDARDACAGLREVRGSSSAAGQPLCASAHAGAAGWRGRPHAAGQVAPLPHRRGVPGAGARAALRGWPALPGRVQAGAVLWSCCHPRLPVRPCCPALPAHGTGAFQLASSLARCAARRARSCFPPASRRTSALGAPTRRWRRSAPQRCPPTRASWTACPRASPRRSARTASSCPAARSSASPLRAPSSRRGCSSTHAETRRSACHLSCRLASSAPHSCQTSGRMDFCCSGSVRCIERACPSSDGVFAVQCCAAACTPA